MNSHQPFLLLFQAKYKDKGSELAEEQLNQMSKQLDAFRDNLEEFAANHKNDIKKNPQFRMHFQEMCATIGVDPLACEFNVYLLIFIQASYMYILLGAVQNGSCSLQ